MAGISTGTSILAANSLVAIVPETSTIGTPVVLSGTPASLAGTFDGQFLYALLPGTATGSIARFNTLSQQLDFTAFGFQATGYNTGLRDLATLPGSPNTIAVDEGEILVLRSLTLIPAARLLRGEVRRQVSTQGPASRSLTLHNCI